MHAVRFSALISQTYHVSFCLNQANLDMSNTNQYVITFSFKQITHIPWWKATCLQTTVIRLDWLQSVSDRLLKFANKCCLISKCRQTANTL